MKGVEIQQAVLPHSPMGKLAATDGFSGTNASAWAFRAMAVNATCPPERARKVHSQPKPSKVGQWLGDLFQGRLKLVREKKLQVVETVSLGEKRFVTILQVEGRKLLIGGSSSRVSLLASLDDAASATESLEFQQDEMGNLQ